MTHHKLYYLLILCLALIVGCDNMGNSPQIDTPEIASASDLKMGDGNDLTQSATVTNNMTVTNCQTGAYGGTIFDNFTYSNNTADAFNVARPAGTTIGDSWVVENDTDNGLFGRNNWLTNCSGSTPVWSAPTKAWHRYNYHNVGLNPKGNFSYINANQSNSRLRLEMEAGYNPNTSHHHPAIRSGFLLNEGSYVARIRFSDFDNGARVMQSFWAHTSSQLDSYQGSSYYKEIDFEFNNWFSSSSSTHHPQMNVGYHPQQGGDISSTKYVMDCIYYNGSHTKDRECEKNNLSWIIGERLSGNYENEWWTLMFVYDGSELRFYMQNDGYGGQSGSVRGVHGGSNLTNSDWDKPVKFPASGIGTKPLSTILSFNWANNSSQYFTSGYGPFIPNESFMEIGWFYFSESTSISIDQAETDVVNLINGGIYRLNSTGEPLDFPVTDLVDY